MSRLPRALIRGNERAMMKTDFSPGRTRTDGIYGVMLIKTPSSEHKTAKNHQFPASILASSVLILLSSKRLIMQVSRVSTTYCFVPALIVSKVETSPLGSKPTGKSFRRKERLSSVDAPVNNHKIKPCLNVPRLPNMERGAAAENRYPLVSALPRCTSQSSVCKKGMRNDICWIPEVINVEIDESESESVMDTRLVIAWVTSKSERSGKSTVMRMIKRARWRKAK